MKMERTRVLALAPEDIEFGPSGTASFFWPVARMESCVVRDCFEKELLAQMSPALLVGDDDWSVLRIMMYEIARDVVGGWQLVALQRRSRDAGFRLAVPAQGYETLAALENDRPFPSSRVLHALRRGLPAPSRWLMPLRSLRSLVGAEKFVRKRVDSLAPGDIVMLSASEFVTNHAQMVQRKGGPQVVMCSFWEWFALRTGDAEKATQTPPCRPEILDGVIGAAERAFAAGGETLPPAMEQALRVWIIDASRWIRFYMNRLRLKPQRLPRTLWYGSVNNWWTRMLRALVKENGGLVVGHDHGSGVGLRPNEGEHGPVFDLCDEYVSYSQPLAEALATVRPEIEKRTPMGVAPLFSSAPPGCLPPPVLSPLSGTTKSERAMYISPMYLGERLAGMNCLPCDPVWLDWQCRLLCRLTSFSIPVAFKAHPESFFPPSERFLKLTGAAPLAGKIEECYPDASSFVTDFLSTPFKTILHTDRPILIIDHGLGKMALPVRALIERRCAIVPGHFTEANRMDTEWGQLSEAMTLAQARRLDRSCAIALFGYPA